MSKKVLWNWHQGQFHKTFFVLFSWLSSFCLNFWLRFTRSINYAKKSFMKLTPVVNFIKHFLALFMWLSAFCHKFWLRLCRSKHKLCQKSFMKLTPGQPHGWTAQSTCPTLHPWQPPRCDLQISHPWSTPRLEILKKFNFSIRFVNHRKAGLGKIEKVGNLESWYW